MFADCVPMGCIKATQSERAKQMIRNMDLIRSIVLAIRDHEGRPSASEVQTIVGNLDNAVYGYHLELLIQGAMMTGVETGPRKDRHGLANLALTWAGQDFADNISNDEVWSDAQKSLEEADLQLASIALWTQVALAKISERLGTGS